MKHAERLTNLTALVGKIAEEVGVELVEMSLRGSSQRRILRVDIDRVGAAGVTLKDCERTSRALGDALEDSEVLGGPFVLEVSSPGLDRPIETPDDVRRNVGRNVRVELRNEEGQPVEIVGLLEATIEDGFRVLPKGAAATDQAVDIRLADVISARQSLDF